MQPDHIDLHQVEFVRSPNVADWPATVGITGIRSTRAGGLELSFDRRIPDSWKWPSNKNVPSENFQYTVSFAIEIHGRWLAAGFVQMWQGRPMGQADHAIPPIFNVAPGDIAPGYVNLWGDPRRMWGELSDYVPREGDRIALYVSAGNGRDFAGVSSVAERSNVVLFTLHASDEYFDDYPDGVTEPPVVEPPTQPPTQQPPPATDGTAQILARLEALENMENARYISLTNLVSTLLDGVTVEGTISLPGLGRRAIKLHVTRPEK